MPDKDYVKYFTSELLHFTPGTSKDPRGTGVTQRWLSRGLKLGWVKKLHINSLHHAIMVLWLWQKFTQSQCKMCYDFLSTERGLFTLPVSASFQTFTMPAAYIVWNPHILLTFPSRLWMRGDKSPPWCGSWCFITVSNHDKNARGSYKCTNVIENWESRVPPCKWRYSYLFWEYVSIHR